MKTFIAILMLSLAFFSCSSTNKRQLIKGELVGENYYYNQNGFVNAPFGRVTIKTHVYYTNQKLTKLLSNHPEGFLEYSLNDLKQDTLLLNHFSIDTVYNLKKIGLNKKITRNDTIFYKLKNNSILISIKK